MSGYQLEAEAEMWDAIASQDRGTASERIRAARATQARRVEDWPEHYSARNCLLLEMSGATEVAGYREWQQLGRQVRKGEHGIKIGAPVVVKDGETGEARVVNVKTATVFDVSQTDPVEV